MKSTILTHKSKTVALYCLSPHQNSWSDIKHLVTGSRSSIVQIDRRLFHRFINFGSIRRGLRTWADETHYSVLGIHHEASQKEIRDAYLKLSKELHPDFNVGRNQDQIEQIHNRFVKINDAYSVLGNKKQRRLYDLEVLTREDPRWRDHGDIRTSSPHSFRTAPMSFEERVQAMGLKKQDPNFYAKHGNYHQKVVLWCVVFIAVGVLVQGTAIMALYNRHAAQLDLATSNNTALLVQARSNARKYTTVQEQWDALNLQPAKIITNKQTEVQGLKVNADEIKTA